MNPHAKSSPSFRGLQPASKASSGSKRMNRSVGTSHERILCSCLWRQGFRYRKNVRTLIGKPDIVFPGVHVVIFRDGDFWHGRNWPVLARKLRAGANARYWIEKIKTNRQRDRRTNRILATEGWTVLRIWEAEIRSNPERVAQKIGALVRRLKEPSHAIY